MDDLLLCQPSKNNTDCRLGSAENYHRLWWFNYPVFAGGCVLDRKVGELFFFWGINCSQQLFCLVFTPFFSPQKVLTLIKPLPCLCHYTVVTRLMNYEHETGLFVMIHVRYIILWKFIILGHPQMEFWPLGGILTWAAVRLEPKFRGGVTPESTLWPVLSEWPNRWWLYHLSRLTWRQAPWTWTCCVQNTLHN